MKSPFYYEDFEVGQIFTAGSITLDAESITTFARSYDPQSFHIDAAAAQDTIFGALTASGWHTAAISMRLFVMAMPETAGGLIGRGAENMAWPRPVYPGDTLGTTVEIIGKRTTKNPARGLLRIKHITTNQHGDTVMEMITSVIVQRKN